MQVSVLTSCTNHVGNAVATLSPLFFSHKTMDFLIVVFLAVISPLLAVTQYFD